MLPFNSVIAASTRLDSKADNLPKPKFFEIPFGPKTIGVEKYVASVISDLKRINNCFSYNVNKRY